jgi:hypothetical protein
MVSSRVTTAVLGVIGSLGLSVLLWVVFETAVFFLFVPFVPFVLGRNGKAAPRPTYRCSTCGFHTTDPNYEYCPRDGTPLRKD